MLNICSFFRTQLYLSHLCSFYNRIPDHKDPSHTHMTDPIKMHIVTPYGFKMQSGLRFLVQSASSKIREIIWRSTPYQLGCDYKFIKSVEKRIGKKGFFLIFIDWEMQIILDNISDESELIEMLQKQIQDYIINGDGVVGRPHSLSNVLPLTSSAPSGASSPQGSPSPTPRTSSGQSGNLPTDFSSYFNQNVLKCEYTAAIKQEQLCQLTRYFRYKEGWLILDKIANKTRNSSLNIGLQKWISFVKHENNEKMLRDRKRWRLHTAANQENDLQAWYHSVFNQEVYRLRGPFWFRDAVLPVYRKSYTIVDTGMTSLEEAAVAHVLCSPDTTYGDVAGHMFVVQAISSDKEYNLFQQLVSQGYTVTKYPRMGRPAKKHFRISFVEGSIYFTWKGKFGNQGINLGEVNSLTEGLATDVLKRTGSSSKGDLYVSLVSSGRSVDLCLDQSVDKVLWKSLLEKLVAKEHGILNSITFEYPEQPSGQPDPDLDLAWFVLYSAIGESIVSPAMKAHLLKVPIS